MRFKSILALAGAILLPIPTAIVVNKIVSPIHLHSPFLHNIVPIIIGMAVGITSILYFPTTGFRKAVITSIYIIVYPVFAITLFVIT